MCVVLYDQAGRLLLDKCLYVKEFENESQRYLFEI